MVRSHFTTHKSIGRQLIGQIAPRDVSPQQEPQHHSPQYVPHKEDPFEIMVMVPMGEVTQQAAVKAQQLP
jgi:hypothetical protein